MENTTVPWAATYHSRDGADTRQGCERIYYRLDPLDGPEKATGPKGSSALAQAISHGTLTANNLLRWKEQEETTKEGPFLRFSIPRASRPQLDADAMLRLACDRGDAASVKKSLSFGAKVNGCLGAAVERGGPFDPPLCTATRGNYVAVVEILLAHGAHVSRSDLLRRTPLVIAVTKGYLEMATLLLANKAKTSKPAPGGKTPLILACSRGYEDMVRLLLKSGSSLELAKASGQSALCAACRGGHVEVANLLLLREVDVCCVEREESNVTRRLVLHEACWNGSVSIVRDVLRRIVKNDYDNCLSLEYSTMKSHNLLRDVKKGMSPLCYGASRGNAKAVACLLSTVGENLIERMVELEDEKQGRTPLMWAAAGGHALVVRLLLGKNANYRKRTKEGDDAWTLAADGGHSSVLVLLEEMRMADREKSEREKREEMERKNGGSRAGSRPGTGSSSRSPSRSSSRASRK